MRKRNAWMAGVIGLAAAATVQAADVGTAFTYQGRLAKNGVPVNSTSPPCVFHFNLWDDQVAGNQVGSPEWHCRGSLPRS